MGQATRVQRGGVGRELFGSGHQHPGSQIGQEAGSERSLNSSSDFSGEAIGRRRVARGPQPDDGWHQGQELPPGTAGSPTAVRFRISIPPASSRLAGIARHRDAGADGGHLCPWLLLAHAPRLPIRKAASDTARLLEGKAACQRGARSPRDRSARCVGLASALRMGVRDAPRQSRQWAPGRFAALDRGRLTVWRGQGRTAKLKSKRSHCSNDCQGGSHPAATRQFLPRRRHEIEDDLADLLGQQWRNSVADLPVLLGAVPLEEIVVREGL
jgi:hypothetical protein